MKRIFSLLFTVLLAAAVLLTACTEPVPVTDPSADSAQDASSEDPQPVSADSEPESAEEPEDSVPSEQELPSESPSEQISEPESSEDESEEPSETEKTESSEAAESLDETSGEVSPDEPEPDDRTVDRTGSKTLVSEGCSYTVTGNVHYMYGDDGTHLTDGKFGGDVGYGWENPGSAEVVIDLGSVKDGLADFTAMLAGDTWGILAPGKAVYSVSDDGNSWTVAGTVEGGGVVKEPAWDEWNYYTYPLELEQSVSGRYVKIAFSENNMNWIWAHEVAVWSYEKQEARKLHAFKGTEEITNLTFANRDKNAMGDQYAPGYCVYSKVGYNKAEMTFELSQADVCNRGTKNGYVTCYVFLGIDVRNENGYWMNCCDAGLTYGGETSGWHLFWATATDENGNRGWNADSKALNPKHDYKIVLDSSKKDGRVKLSAIDLYDGSIADTMEFELWGSKADGSNTSYLTDIAIDWADENTMVDTNGNPTSIENWVEITKANMGQGIHLKNIRLYDIALYKGKKRYEWKKDLTDRRGIWSDKNDPITTVTTRISHIVEDYEYIVDLDLG